MAYIPSSSILSTNAQLVGAFSTTLQAAKILPVSLNLEHRQISLAFSNRIDPTTYISNTVTLQAAKILTNKYTLTSSTVIGITKAVSVTLALSTEDNFYLGSQAGLACDRSTPHLIMLGRAFNDIIGQDIVELTNGKDYQGS